MGVFTPQESQNNKSGLIPHPTSQELVVKHLPAFHRADLTEKEVVWTEASKTFTDTVIFGLGLTDRRMTSVLEMYRLMDFPATFLSIMDLFSPPGPAGETTAGAGRWSTRHSRTSL